MSWKIKRSHDPYGEPDALVARLHPVVGEIQLRLRNEQARSAAIDVLRVATVCLEAASSLVIGRGWPTTDVSEYYGEGPEPSDLGTIEQLMEIIREGVPEAILARASDVFQNRPTAWAEDADVHTYGQRLSAITTALLKCVDLPDALQQRPS